MLSNDAVDANRVGGSRGALQRAQCGNRLLEHRGGLAQTRDFCFAQLQPQNFLDAAAVDHRRQAEADIVYSVVIVDQARDRQHRVLMTKDGLRVGYRNLICHAALYSRCSEYGS